MNDPNADGYGWAESLVQAVYQRGVCSLAVLAVGCCVGGLVGTVGGLLGAIGGGAAAATWLKRHGDLGTRRRTASGDRQAVERGIDR